MQQIPIISDYLSVSTSFLCYGRLMQYILKFSGLNQIIYITTDNLSWQPIQFRDGVLLWILYYLQMMPKIFQ